jgi:hypothetical protein
MKSRVPRFAYPDRPVFRGHDRIGAVASKPLGGRKGSDRKIAKIVDTVGRGRPDYTVVAFVQIKDASLDKPSARPKWSTVWP